MVIMCVTQSSDKAPHCIDLSTAFQRPHENFYLRSFSLFLILKAFVYVPHCNLDQRKCLCSRVS